MKKQRSLPRWRRETKDMEEPSVDDEDAIVVTCEAGSKRVVLDMRDSYDTLEARVAELDRSGLAKPSPFGKGANTVVDESVRSAVEVSASHLKLSPSLRRAVGEMLGEIQSELVPDALEVTAELHKLNIYRKGGHFNSHLDTPRGRDSFGSLVIGLPVSHFGGTLRIAPPGTPVPVSSDEDEDEDEEPEKPPTPPPPPPKKRGRGRPRKDETVEKPEPVQPPQPTVVRFDQFYAVGELADRFRMFSSTMAALDDMVRNNKPTRRQLAYAAFFGDCAHEVSEVYAGMRVTLAFILRRHGEHAKPKEALRSFGLTVQQPVSVLQKTLLRVLEDDKFASDGTIVGFGCMHMYEDQDMNMLERVSVNMLDDEALDVESGSVPTTALIAQRTLACSRLKGADAALALVFVNAGLQVRPYRYLEPTADMGIDGMLISKMPSKELMKSFGRWEYIENDFAAWACRDSDFGIFGAVPGVNEVPHVWLTSPRYRAPSGMPTKACIAEEIFYNSDGYYGNEASPVDFYTYVGLCVHIPEVGSDLRKEAIKRLQNPDIKFELKSIKMPKKTPAAELAEYEKRCRRGIEIASRKKKKPKPVSRWTWGIGPTDDYDDFGFMPAALADPALSAAMLDVGRMLHVLQARGPREPPPNRTGGFWKLKVAELKEKLKDLGLPRSGAKAELIERLEKAGATPPGGDDTVVQVDSESS